MKLPGFVFLKNDLHYNASGGIWICPKCGWDWSLHVEEEDGSVSCKLPAACDAYDDRLELLAKQGHIQDTPSPFIVKALF